MHPAFQGLLTIVIGVGACLSYFYFSNQFLDKVLFPAKNIGAEAAKRSRMMALAVFVGIPFLAFLWFMVFPAIRFGAFSGDTFAALIICIVLLAALLFVVLKTFPATERTAGDNINRANLVRPWLFLFPALFALGLYLAYPVIETIRLSLTERVTQPDGSSVYRFIGMANYSQMASEPKFWEAMRNNLMWLVVVPAMSTAFGLLAAQLTDRIKWGNIAKSLIFMPMAISFVGAAVIWKLVYDARPPGTEQIGVLNAIYVWATGNDPQQWLTIPFWNNFLLMIVLIWIQTGFAMVILSAALRGIPEETIEAAIVDGANPFQIFFKIKMPQIAGTIVVVWTTITLVVLKIFDIVFAMTNGQWETQVLANYMFDKLFRANDWGVGSASAIVIMLMVTPILVWNVRNARKEMR